MRRYMSDFVFYGLWILTGLGFAGVYWIIGAQESVAHALTAELDAAERAIAAGEWSRAADVVDGVIGRWRRIEKRWALHTQHEQLEAVAEALLEAETLIGLHDAQALAPLRLARERLLTLPRRDRLLLENLL